MHTLRAWFSALVLVVLVPAAAFAQASISGVVKDASGAILPGVTVEAASPVLIEKTKSAVTDGAGLYRIVDLRPGTYSMTFTLGGFTTVKREGIELTGTFTATINADLKVGAIAETITVTGETPVVDVQSAKREVVLTGDVIASLPGTHAYGNLLNAIPGVTVDNNGIANAPTMTFFTARGGSTNEGRMSINGMVVAASFNGGGVSSLAYDANNVDEVSVVVAGGLGDTDVGGPVMNLVPRTGGNTFKGQVFMNYAGGWSTRQQPRRSAAQPPDADHARPRHHPLLRRQPFVRWPAQTRQTVVLGKLSQVRDRAGRRGHLRQQVRARRDALGLPEGHEHFSAQRTRAATSFKAGSRRKSRRRTA